MHYAGARSYMSALGRWGTTDPVAGLYPGHSPYNYVLNNPLSFFDGTGLCPEGVETGETFDTDQGATLCYDAEGATVTAERYDEEEEKREKDTAISWVGWTASRGGSLGGAYLQGLGIDHPPNWMHAVREGRVAPLPEGRELQVMGARTLKRAGWVATGAIALYEIKEAETGRERGRVATRTAGSVVGGTAVTSLALGAAGCIGTGGAGCVVIGVGAGAVGGYGVGRLTETVYDWALPPAESESE
jgi:hypothetical protein